MTEITQNPVSYDKNTDYQALMNQAVANNDYASAAQYEQQRNAKIAGEGITGYEQTSNYSQYLQNNTNSQPASQSSGGMKTSVDDYRNAAENVYNASQFVQNPVNPNWQVATPDHMSIYNNHYIDDQAYIQELYEANGLDQFGRPLVATNQYNADNVARQLKLIQNNNPFFGLRDTVEDYDADYRAAVAAGDTRLASELQHDAQRLRDAMAMYSDYNSAYATPSSGALGNKTVADYDADYANARSRGDWLGMQQAAMAANELRASAGLPLINPYDDVSYIRELTLDYRGNPIVYSYDANGNPIYKTFFAGDKFDGDAYIINGMAYRDPQGTQPLPLYSVYNAPDGQHVITPYGDIARDEDVNLLNNYASDYYGGYANQFDSGAFAFDGVTSGGSSSFLSANSSKIPSRNKATGGTSAGSASNGFNATDASEYIKNMYEKSAEAAIQQLKTTYDKNLATVNEEAEKLPDLYQTYKNALAAEYEVNRMRMNESGSANGMTNGAEAQMQLSANNTYTSKLYDFELKEAEQMAALERDRANLKIDYDNAVAQAVLNNDLQQAEALLQEFIRLDDARIQAAYYQAEYDYKMLTYQTSVDQFNQQMAYQQAMDQAELAYKYAALGAKSGSGTTSNPGPYTEKLSYTDLVNAAASMTPEEADLFIHGLSYDGTITSSQVQGLIDNANVQRDANLAKQESDYNDWYNGLTDTQKAVYDDLGGIDPNNFYQYKDLTGALDNAVGVEKANQLILDLAQNAALTQNPAAYLWSLEGTPVYGITITPDISDAVAYVLNQNQ